MNALDVFYDHLSGKTFSSDLGKLLYLDTKVYLQDGVLVKVDRASMAHGLEVRVPFLDHRFVELIAGIPEKFKLKGLTTKYIFKKTMKHKLPKDIVFRKKKGFGIPAAQWITWNLRDLFLEVFSEERITRQGIFDYQAIQGVLHEHFTRRADNKKKLWNLLMFQLWWDNYYRS
jgi:asparagine synthase (glutamine-hydrolysing)